MDKEHEKHGFGAIVVAAGSGSRMGGDVPKQFRPLGGRPVFRHSLDTLRRHPASGPVVLVVAESELERARAMCADDADVTIIAGGNSRRESVVRGLDRLSALPSPPALVLIHDAARPGLSADVVDRLLAALDRADGAVPILPVPDSAARIEGGLLSERVERAGLARVQTPQAFRLPAIACAHAAWPNGQEATDDAGMLMAAGSTVAAVEGDERLMKLTVPRDFARYEALEGAAMPDFRIGKGYDVHRLEEGEELWLAGVRIAHSHGLAGHSDADVAIHALCDAIFGALADGDIGIHFPPSDEKWRGAPSRLFLQHAVESARKRGFAIANCDITLICEAPKIGPHREAMRETLSEIMALPVERISVKATTTEKLGFTGRCEGIAADAVVLLGRG